MARILWNIINTIAGKIRIDVTMFMDITQPCPNENVWNSEFNEYIEILYERLRVNKISRVFHGT